MPNSDLTGPIETTGAPTIDAAIARFIHNPATLRCDIRSDWVDYWAQGGTDGRPTSRYRAPLWSVDNAKAVPRETAYTRADILEARA